jgi:hypothetical protein
MRLDKIQTEKQAAPVPYIAKISEGWAVFDAKNQKVKVFEDSDVATAYMKRHLTELKEGRTPVVYMSEIMEGVLDDQDEDGWMAKSELYKLAKDAIALHGMIQDTDNLEPWVQSKITKASDYINSIRNYMEYLSMNEYPQGAPTVVDDLSDEGL